MIIRKATVAAIGKRYGMLTIVGLSHQNSESRWVMLCACDCGNYVCRQLNNLETGIKLGAAQSCGCAGNPKKRTHGLRSHPLYQTWKSMMQRCYNPADKHYKDYGGRGIAVATEWHDVTVFVTDMSPKPDGLYLDRIDNNAGYSKANCRWATMQEQGRNMRSNVHITGRCGRTMTLVEWAEELGIKPVTLYMRRHRGWSDEEILYGR